MNKLAELLAAIKAQKAAGLKIINEAEAAGRDLTAEEDQTLDDIQADIEEKTAEAEALQKAQDRKRRFEAVAGSTTALTPVGGQSAPQVQQEAPRAYGQMATHDSDPALTHGYADLAEFANSVRFASKPGSGFSDARLMAAPTNYHTGGGDGGEGFQVPPQFAGEIFSVMESADELTPLLDSEDTSARRVEGYANEETPWGSTGVQAAWRSEGAQLSPSKLADQSRSIVLHEISAFVLATEELLEDAPRLAGRLTTRAGQALAWKRNQSFIYGTGSGQPLGWMKSGALITVAKESGQAADTINDQNVLKMYSRLSVIPGDTPFWLANRNTIPQLGALTIGDQPMFMLAGAGLRESPFIGFLLGAPVMWSEHAATLGDLGDLQLVSGKGYHALRRSGGAKFAQSIHLYFDYNVEAFRWTTRFGGQPHMSAPIDAPTEGGGSANSKSNFVTLEERA